jgi:hypothetical protein
MRSNSTSGVAAEYQIGGERAATIYTDIATAKLNNLNPEGSASLTCSAKRFGGLSKALLSRSGQANEMFINNFRIIGQGPVNNFLVHETLHFTINADGTVTVFHDNFSVCK